MRKIGILFGQENTFPQAFIDRVNQKIAAQGIKDMMAEAVLIETVEQAKSDEYAVIIDRISQDRFGGVQMRSFLTMRWQKK